MHSNPRSEQQPNKRPPLYRRLTGAWRNTPTKWYPLPVGIGALLLATLSLKRRRWADEDHPTVSASAENKGVRIKGAWQLHVLGALPLRNLSRLWGYLNGFELPVWLRPAGFRMYSWIFNCNLDEIDPPELTAYASLGEFFARRLKPGARPIANTTLVSPADGKVLHFGTIHGSQVEQVKGLTYSLDALLGVPSATSAAPTRIDFANRDHEAVIDEEFANVNGITYTFRDLVGESDASEKVEQVDASVSTPTLDVAKQDLSVAADIGIRPILERGPSGVKVMEGNNLFFAVIYLAPGDYHRFHSPAAWVVEKRRHFSGELFSVSPYLAKRVANLFVLNERVALLGRWKHGFFSMIPVGATNVGSIRINFDSALRTNVWGRRPPPGTYNEATYAAASTLLGGQPLTAGQEMGGFSLGSTIVLVFEAPPTFEFLVRAGQKIKVGESLGDVSGLPYSP